MVPSLLQNTYKLLFQTQKRTGIHNNSFHVLSTCFLNIFSNIWAQIVILYRTTVPAVLQKKKGMDDSMNAWSQDFAT